MKRTPGSDKQRWYFAPCSPGLEEVLETEVQAAGGARIRRDRGGVSFQGRRRVGYHLALWSRVAVRVLEELARKKVSDADDLYRLAGTLRWHTLLSQGQTFAIHAAVSGARIRHGPFAAQRVKDAIVDQLRQTWGDRPSVDRDDPDLPLKLTVRQGVATLARDLAGESLHRRGWRPIQVKSPLNEALAAGLVAHTAWDRTAPLADPMCGSGTLLIEAAHLAGDRAPGLRRPMALTRFRDHDAALWDGLLEDAEARWARGRERIPALRGNDLHPGAVEIARDAAVRAEVDHAISFRHGDIDSFAPDPVPELVVVNPPYGVRLEPGAAWRQLGGWLRGLPGGTAWVLSGDPELTRHLGLRADRRIPVQNGGIDCRWIRYPMRSHP